MMLSQAVRRQFSHYGNATTKSLRYMTSLNPMSCTTTNDDDKQKYNYNSYSTNMIDIHNNSNNRYNNNNRIYSSSNHSIFNNNNNSNSSRMYSTIGKNNVNNDSSSYYNNKNKNNNNSFSSNSIISRRNMSSSLSVAEMMNSSISLVTENPKVVWAGGDIKALSVGAQGNLEAINVAQTVMEELSWWQQPVVDGLLFIQSTGDIPLWAAIISFTLCVRSMILPLMIQSMKHSGRMAIMRPEQELIVEQSKKLDMTNPEVQQKYKKEMKGLFAKHKVKFRYLFLGPIANMSVFLPTFMILREPPPQIITFFHDGGALWFTDLSIPDPMYVLPGLVSMTFFGMTKVGMDGMEMQNEQMKKFFQLMPFVMLPVSCFMPAGVLLYWTTANSFGLVQSLSLKNPAVKKYLGIPNPPKLLKNAEKDKKNASSGNPFSMIMDKMNERKQREELAKQEIIYGVKPPPPPGEKKEKVKIYSNKPTPKSKRKKN